MTMNTWTIIATLITGAVLGFFFFAGLLYALIASEDRRKEAAKNKLPFNVTMIDPQNVQDQR